MTQAKSIAFLRESKGLTQVDLANAIGCTQASISQIERGQRKISRGLALSLEAALGQALPKDIVKDLLYLRIKRLSPKAAESILNLVEIILKYENRNAP